MAFGQVERLAKNKQKPVSTEAGVRLARQLRAVKYAECSALTREGLKDVFDQAILAVCPPVQDDRKNCAVS